MRELKNFEFKGNFDIRPEALAATLLTQDNELDIDQLILAPMGADRRRCGDEIIQIQKRVFDDLSVLQIDMARKGLFDILPEGLLIDTNKAHKSAKERSKSINKQIQTWRSFFLPFEEIINWPRIEIAMLEDQWANTFPKVVHKIWGLDNYDSLLDNKRKLLLSYILPLCDQIAGNWSLTELCLEAILNRDVMFEFIQEAPIAIETNSNLTANYRLGEDALLGDQFIDDLPVLHVKIQQIRLDEVEDYLEGGTIHSLLNELIYPFIIPMEYKIRTSIFLEEEEKGMVVGHTYLGVDCVIARI